MPGVSDFSVAGPTSPHRHLPVGMDTPGAKNSPRPRGLSSPHQPDLGPSGAGVGRAGGVQPGPSPPSPSLVPSPFLGVTAAAEESGRLRDHPRPLLAPSCPPTHPPPGRRGEPQPPPRQGLGVHPCSPRTPRHLPPCRPVRSPGAAPRGPRSWSRGSHSPPSHRGCSWCAQAESRRRGASGSRGPARPDPVRLPPPLPPPPPRLCPCRLPALARPGMRKRRLKAGNPHSGDPGVLGLASGSVASDDGQSRGTSLRAHGWGEKEPQEHPEGSPPKRTALTHRGVQGWRPWMHPPVLPSHLPPRSASAPTAAEPRSGLVSRCSKAGRKPEAAAVSRKPCAAASQFRGTGVSAGTVAGAPAHNPQHPMLPVGAWLTAHFIWEKAKCGNEGEVLGEKQECCVTQKLSPQNPIKIRELWLWTVAFNTL